MLGGDATAGAEGHPLGSGQLAVSGNGETITVRANEQQDSRHPGVDVLFLGGQPIREPVVACGPFVMTTKAEIAQAMEDFQKGRLGVIPAEHPARGAVDASTDTS